MTRLHAGRQRMRARGRRLLPACAVVMLVTGPTTAQDQRRVAIEIEGTLPAQCVSEPVRVLVTNEAVRVTQYLRCNHPGRFVIRLDEGARGHWRGSKATRKGRDVSLDGGSAEFPIDPSPGTEETVVLTAKNPASLRALAQALSTAVLVQ